MHNYNEKGILMSKRFKIFLLTIFLVVPFFVMSCAHARKPPKPGPDFIWVTGHKMPTGAVTPGHWKYTGPNVKHKTWVSGHHGPGGKWVDGHWKPLDPPKKGSAWVPGHHGPKGKWIPGHWR